MTFAEAVAALDAEGKYGAKRPSMRGYAKASPVEGGETPANDKTVALIGADGNAATFTYRDGLVGELGDGWAASSEMMNALVFARDWEIAPADDLEKARAGKGTM